ncbi:leucine-rich repeat protein [Tanacetum coccineum]
MTGNLTNLPSGERLHGAGYQDSIILLLQSNYLFRGSIPVSLCKRTDLDILDLSRNMLIGNIPDCMGNLYVTKMILSSNKLSGVIPSSFGLRSGLTQLQLNDNNLRGSILSHASSNFLKSLKTIGTSSKNDNIFTSNSYSA